MDGDWSPIVLPEPKRLGYVRWIWLALVFPPAVWLFKNWQILPFMGLLVAALMAWCWYVYFDLQPPYGLLFDGAGNFAIARDETQMSDFLDGEPAILVGSQFFEHWVALQIRLPNRPKRRGRLFLLLSGADAWHDNDWHTLRVHLLHLKNRSSAA